MKNKQTAVDWLVNEVANFMGFIPTDIIEKAKEMEKEQIMKTARQCHFEGVRQSAKTTLEYIIYAELYYQEKYEKL